MKNLPEISLANEAYDSPVLPAGQVLPGRFSLANEERFTAAYLSEGLTQYAVGWSDSEDLGALTDFIAPRVTVSRRFEYKSAVNAEAFLSDAANEDLRAIGSEFKRVEYKSVSANSKTDNRGLTYRIDLDEEGGNVISEQLITGRLLQRCKRNQFRRAMTALLAAANNTAVTWSSGASVPDEDVRNAIQRAQLSAGVFPNKLLIDLMAWNKRKQGMAAQFTASALAGYLWKPEDMGQDQGVEVKLSKAVYQSSASGKSYIAANKAIAFIGQDNPSKDDPTSVKRFVTPVGDGDFRVYRMPVGAKFVDITVEYYDNIVATSSVGTESLTVS